MTKTSDSPQRYSAVIFDLDGTLLDTLEDIAEAMNHVLKKRGHRTFGVGDYKALVGDGIEVLIRRAFSPSPPGDEETAEIIGEFRAEYERRWRNHSRPYPGIRSLLRALVARGISLAVLSNKAHVFTERMTLELLPEFKFRSIKGAVPGVPLKPDPAPALLIAEELGVPAASFAFLGDTKMDIIAARSAGMLPVGALWGFRGEEELRSNGAAALISSPMELLDLL